VPTHHFGRWIRSAPAVAVMNADLSHLDALRARLAREQRRLDHATSIEERDFRTSLVNQVKREIKEEYDFLDRHLEPEVKP